MAPSAAVVHLAVRQVLRSTTAVAVTMLGMIAATVTTFDATQLGSSSGLHDLAENPALRALYGQPAGIDTAAGFTVWRLGTFVLLTAGLWAVLTTTRVLRGEEEAGRWELLLAGPLRTTDLALGELTVVGAAALIIAAGTSLGFIATAQPPAGAVLFGTGVLLATVTFGAVGALTSQLFSARRRAAGVAGALLGGAFLVRMIADASESASWLRWFSPMGWVELLEPYGTANYTPLVLLAVAPAALLAASFWAMGRRDLGEGMIRSSSHAAARTRLLGSPLGFAWRARLGGLTGWSAGMAAFGLVIGGITKAFVDFIAADPEMREQFERLGLGTVDQIEPFLAAMFQFAAIGFAAQSISAMHGVVADEAAGCLELPFALPVRRDRWLLVHVAATVGAVSMVAVATGAATWVGVRLTGAPLPLWSAVACALNTLPAAAVFLGITVAFVGVRPRSAVTAGGGALAAAYLLMIIGPALNLPEAVVDLSPFRHLGTVPSAPPDWTATAVMTAIGAFGVAVGVLTYRRRDLR